ncbi:TPM domain-containing protein [Streptomyces aculeolatus]
MRIRRLGARLCAAGFRALLPLALLTSAAPPASAAPAPARPLVDPLPLDPDGQVTDRVDALRDRRGDVADALERLDREQRTRLFVAYVRDFSDFSAQAWADATAERNGLGRRDVLLAVATGDHEHAVSAAAGSGISERDTDAVDTRAVEPALRQNDWAGAAIGAADGYAAVLDGRQVPPPDVTPGPTYPGGAPRGESAEGDVSPTDFVVPAAAVLAVALGAALYFSRRRRAADQAPPHWPHDGVSTPDLDARARELLVETDDAVRTSQEELGIAADRFGEAAARPFAEAVGQAGAELTAAFRLRQALDDASPEDDAARRAMLEEILAHCTDANARLDAESDAFDRLRARVPRAPQALATAEAAARLLPDRIGAAEDTLTTLAGAYDAASFAAVAGNPGAARDRLRFAAGNVTRARTALRGDDPATAAVHVRAAESAVDQAGTLVEAVARRERELHEAAARLTGALRDMRADLADAQGALRGTAADEPDTGLRDRVARAQRVLAEVTREMVEGPFDPLAALRRVEEADAALEEALAGAREQDDAGRADAGRAGRLLDRALVGARSSVAAARDFVTTRRGGIGPAARTRLGEGERHLRQAEEHAGTDAAGALRHAQRADELGREARRLAELDLRGFDGSYGGGPFGGPCGAGHGGGGRGGMGTGLLGGIILGGMLGNGFGGSRGAGFGGGSGRGPGSFGGGGTRGRMGGGDRF